MSTQLLQDFPELAHLTYAVCFSRGVLILTESLVAILRREDLEELLVDPAYFQAVFHSLEQVKALYRAQGEVGAANEAIARMYQVVCTSANTT